MSKAVTLLLVGQSRGLFASSYLTHRIQFLAEFLNTVL